MEKRLGIVAIIIGDRSSVSRLNAILGEGAELIVARLGLPMRGKGISLISLVVEGDTDELGALTGKIGRLPGIQVTSVLTKFKEASDGERSDEGIDTNLY
ncbi:MAG: CopG family transcriptional regulator [Treponema sp.]|nr:CopG family transcriptional regulator [Treponema sp.]